MRFQLSCPRTRQTPTEDVWTEQTAISPSDVPITSLVADVRGFSALSQKAESAAVYSMIKEIFAQFSDIVIAHHGTVKDYVGDAVFAFWEHPGDYSADHALSACRAALDQWRRVPEIHRQLLDRGVALPLPVLGWGMATGRITLSHFGSRSADLALVGDCINLAFRLSSMANQTLRSPIVMCRQTAGLVEHSLPLVDLDSQDIRGRSGQERLFGIKLN